MILGKKIILGNEEYTLPPLPLVHMHLIGKLQNGGDPSSDPAYAEGLVEVIHKSLLRNYPDLERATVSDNLDMLNYRELMESFMAVNGFTTAKVQQSGEAVAAS